METLAAEFASEETPKGEIVVLIGPPSPQTEPRTRTTTSTRACASTLANLSLKDAVDVVAQETGLRASASMPGPWS